MLFAARIAGMLCCGAHLIGNASAQSDQVITRDELWETPLPEVIAVELSVALKHRNYHCLVYKDPEDGNEYWLVVGWQEWGIVDLWCVSEDGTKASLIDEDLSQEVPYRSIQEVIPGAPVVVALGGGGTDWSQVALVRFDLASHEIEWIADRFADHDGAAPAFLSSRGTWIWAVWIGPESGWRHLQPYTWREWELTLVEIDGSEVRYAAVERVGDVFVSESEFADYDGPWSGLKGMLSDPGCDPWIWERLGL